MRRRPLKVAFIGGRGVGGAYSGIETYYEEVGKRLAQRGHEVTAYCRSHFTPDCSLHRGMHILRLPALRTKHLETFSHSLLCTLDSFRRGFDIIQYHAIGSAPFSLLPRLCGRATIVSVRGLDWRRAKWGRLARTFLKATEWTSARWPTATVVVSRTLQEHYTRAYGRQPFLIPNAVTPSRPCAPERIKRYGLRKDSFLLFAGRLSPEKGVHTLLEAYRPLQQRINLVLAGGSSYSHRYIQQLRQQACEGVVFLGNVDRSIMKELYSNCYAFVLPSTMEGLSVSLLEAVSHGACILATNIPENQEVVASAALSFLPGDAAALQALLRRVLDDPELVRQYRKRASEEARRRPDWDAVAAETEATYYRLVLRGAGKSKRQRLTT